MRLRILEIEIENFKGIKKFLWELNGKNGEVDGDNGKCKTTIKDAFRYLFFNKDSTGATDFNSRPNDKLGNPLNKLVIMVRCKLEIDGVAKDFKRTNSPKMVLKELKGFENDYWIEKAPKKLGEFKEVVKNIIPEDVFKILSNTSHFAETFKWPERRALLLSITKETETPEGFDLLLGKLNGRTVEEYKSVIKEEIKGLTKELKEINPRIDELQRSIDIYSENAGDLESEQLGIRDTLQKQLDDLVEENKSIETRRDDHEKALKEVSEAQDELSKLGRQSLFFKPCEKKQRKIKDLNTLLENQVGEHRSQVEFNQKEEDKLKPMEKELLVLTKKRVDVGDRWRKVAQEKKTQTETKKTQAQSKENVDTICPTCDQDLPVEKIDSAKKEIQLKIDQTARAIITTKQVIDDITKEGNSLKEEIEALEKSIEDQEKIIKDLILPSMDSINETKEKIGSLESELVNDRSDFENGLEDPKTSEAYLKKQAEIETLKESAAKLDPSSIITEYRIKEKEIVEELRVCNSLLSEADQAKKNQVRITELESNEGSLGDAILKLQEQLKEVDDYNRAESSLIEKNINSHFEKATFRLFKDLKNGGLEQCCEIMMNGVQYHELSAGEKILVGLDIIKTLSSYFGFEVPIFIDNAEGFHFKVDFNSQYIKLNAIRGVKTLKLKLV